MLRFKCRSYLPDPARRRRYPKLPSPIREAHFYDYFVVVVVVVDAVFIFLVTIFSSQTVTAVILPVAPVKTNMA